MNDSELRKLIRETLFKNIDFGNGAPNDVAPDSDSSTNVIGKPQEELSKSINQDETVRKQAYSKVLKNIQRGIKPGIRGDVFAKSFGDINKKYDKARAVAIKEIKNKKKLSDRATIKNIEIASKEMKEFLKKASPNSISDRDVIDWYQIK